MKRAILILAVVGTALPSVVLAASIQGPRRSALERLQEGDAIRKRVQLRGGRFEATPVLGFTLNDAFRRNVLFGAHLGYHFTDTLEIGVSGMAGTAFNSDLADRIESKREDQAEAGAFADISLLVSLDLKYTPLIGKFALFGRSVVNYDLHVMAGLGGSQVGGSTEVEEFALAPMLGIGMRAFITSWGAITFELRDYIFSSSLNAVSDRDEGGDAESSAEFSNNFAMLFGFAFFLPAEPEIGN